MVHLSVAIGRFVEAILWAMLRVAGGLTAIVVGTALTGAILFGLARAMLSRRRR